MGLFLFYAALLDARVTGAQTDGGTTEETTGGGSTSDGECNNAELVATFRGTPGEDQTTDTFEISDNRFRVSFDNQGTGFSSALVTINNEDEDFEADFVDSFIADGEGNGDSLILNAGPGNFFLEIDASGEDTGYVVTVESCGGSGQGGGTTNDEDTDNDGVIDDTIPKKDLPDTGGFTALMIGGSALLLLYGSLVAWRLKTREQ